MRILIVEDERKLADNIARLLRQERYECEQAHDGMTALDRLYTHHFDLMLLDVMLPGLDGITLLRQIREQDNDLPVLMLTARDRIEDRVGGLDAGADDYLSKPFSNLELLARIRSLLRRRGMTRSGIVIVGTLSLDTQTRVVTHADERVDLTAKEFILLELFMLNPDVVLTRLQISEYLWGESGMERSSNAINAHLKNLRKKLGSECIETVHALGYVLRSKKAGDGQ